MAGLQGKVALITGSASGMGKKTAQRLAERGVKIVINDIVPEKVEQTVQEFRSQGFEVMGKVADICNATAVAEMVKEAVERVKRVADWFKDLDIICPCDYRDPDLAEYGCCYCALYVSEAVLKGEKNVLPIPERRPSPEKQAARKSPLSQARIEGLAYPVWRCKVCGYLCARESPPEICPICKAKKDRFERFI